MTTSQSPVLAPGKLPGDLLARLISQYRTPADDSVVVDARYGFDAAAISVGTDTLIVKSDPITFATEDAAHYLVAVNANDISCMGGIPRWLTVVALLPEHTTTPDLVEGLFSDLQLACTVAGISIVGGHTEITLGVDRPLLIGTMLGTIGPSGLLAPGKATAGDQIFVTKWIGLEGTALLANERADELSSALGDDIVASAAALLKNPGIAISGDAQQALGTGVVVALHDPTEGGLATAVHELAEASGLGAVIEREAIPIRAETRRLCDHFGIDPLGLLSSGSLLVAVSPDAASTLENAFANTGIPIHHIGYFTGASGGCWITSANDRSSLPRYDSDELTRVLS